MLPFIQATIERSSGVSDYGMGRESEVLGQNATWRGTQAIIQEMMVRMDGYIKRKVQMLKPALFKASNAPAPFTFSAERILRFHCLHTV